MTTLDTNNLPDSGTNTVEPIKFGTTYRGTLAGLHFGKPPIAHSIRLGVSFVNRVWDTGPSRVVLRDVPTSNGKGHFIIELTSGDAMIFHEAMENSKIDYATGDWSFTLSPNEPELSDTIAMTYRYTDPTSVRAEPHLLLYLRRTSIGGVPVDYEYVGDYVQSFDHEVDIHNVNVAAILSSGKLLPVDSEITHWANRLTQSPATTTRENMRPLKWGEGELIFFAKDSQGNPVAISRLSGDPDSAFVFGIGQLPLSVTMQRLFDEFTNMDGSFIGKIKDDAIEKKT